MNLTISGHHLEITPAIRQYVEAKIARVKRHFDNVIDISVILSVEKLRENEKQQRAEINLHVSGKDFHAQSVDQNLYAAIDLLMDKIDRQVVKHKDKIQTRPHKAIKHMADEFTPPSQSAA